ncbi:hypothetical protein [Parerythrobacter lacustris]|uniref:Hedgehog/Intein (Hint) domain-containing protein n=1 Tax=Parerythrobacter lacustris TaxID=2969984 RepID=A0ABT1XQA7_9SPHN|nr:hypothetical protein [Parerythrobacter lacustris]MCR2832815.1 hypothetical protein [Parerythrobacter lacustris]
MFSGRKIRSSLLIAGVATGLVLAGGAQAGVVVKSSGPSAGQYPPGKKLDDASSVTLKPGDTLTILADGGTRVISGPGTHRVAARGTSRRTTMATLTQQRPKERRIPTATRTGAALGTAPASNLWQVDVTKSGAMCLPDLSALTFFRPGGDQPSTYMLTAPGMIEHIHVAFPANESLVDMDSDTPTVKEGVDYVLTGPGGESSVISFKTLAEPATTGEALGLQLMENGCESQLELLTAKMMPQ